MKIRLLTICGEADHPLLPAFREYYKEYDPIIQMGVVDKWRQVNGDTSESGNYFAEKTEQHNAALEQVPFDTDYILYFDVDEFLPKPDLIDLAEWLQMIQPEVVSLQMNNFWKHQGYIGTGGAGWAYDAWCPRVFKFYEGMRYSSHRPPILQIPGRGESKIEDRKNWPFRVNHYSYVYEATVKRKLLYYNKLYPQFNYMSWFHEVWAKWTPANREQIESKHSIHPSCAGAKSVIYNGKHYIKWQS
jgi:glycosyltransferase involved in cell wall biosynthesis